MAQGDDWREVILAIVGHHKNEGLRIVAVIALLGGGGLYLQTFAAGWRQECSLRRQGRVLLLTGLQEDTMQVCTLRSISVMWRDQVVASRRPEPSGRRTI
jgi:hypothetical protein